MEFALAFYDVFFKCPALPQDIEKIERGNQARHYTKCNSSCFSRNENEFAINQSTSCNRNWSQWDTWASLNEFNRCMLGSMSERANPSSQSISFKHDRLRFLINTNVEKLCSHKHVVQNWRRILRAFLRNLLIFFSNSYPKFIKWNIVEFQSQCSVIS